MNEQLFRWVKASERMPDKTGRTICLRLGEPIVAYAVLRSDGEMRFETPASTVWKGYKDFEWLEPYTPSLNAGSLEQDFKEINVYLNDLYHNMTHDVKDAGHLWIAFTDKFNAFRERVLAGAAYVKGGEEKGLTKEEIAQICEMADNDYAAQESITFLEWVGKEGWKWSELNTRWFKYGSDDYLNETQLHEKFKERDVTEEHKSDREPEGIDIVKTENELLSKCLNMLRYFYMNEYCGEHGPEVFELIRAK